MSNIYIKEPNTEGKVLMHTSFGDLDIELWPQQAPKACRNFVQLCLEGYYDNTVFHRLISKFILQGGDPTGTGKGGESIFGKAFVDEYHSRLRFNHRGLLAMANENKPNTNHSQFFFTLDSADFLNGKHTIFGKITGNTIFNLLSVGQMDTDSDDRPLEEIKLKNIEVLWNPFEDIVPRSTVKKTSMDNKETTSTKKQIKGKRDIKLLSFGDDDEEEEEDNKKKTMMNPKRIKSVHDTNEDPKLSAEADIELLEDIKKAALEKELLEKHESDKSDLKNAIAKKQVNEDQSIFAEKMRQKIASKRKSLGIQKPADLSNESRINFNEELQLNEEEKKKQQVKQQREEYNQLKTDLLKSRKAISVKTGLKAAEEDSATAFHEMLTPLQQRRQKYIKSKKIYGKREKQTLELLSKFQGKLCQVKKEFQDNNHVEEKESKVYHGQIDEESSDDNDDKSWMVSKLKFKKHIDDSFRSGEYHPSNDDYQTIDTRKEGSDGVDLKLQDRRKVQSLRQNNTLEKW